MARTPSTELPFTEDDTSQVVKAMRELEQARSGWVNLSPEIEEGYEPPPRTSFAWLFSGRGEPVPLATWTAPEDDSGRCTIGISHGSGPKALDRLHRSGLTMPGGWRRMSDHSRRGLVLNTDGQEDLDDLIDWLIEACHVLADVPFTGHWLATVYRPASS